MEVSGETKKVKREECECEMEGKIERRTLIGWRGTHTRHVICGQTLTLIVYTVGRLEDKDFIESINYTICALHSIKSQPPDGSEDVISCSAWWTTCPWWLRI